VAHRIQKHSRVWFEVFRDELCPLITVPTNTRVCLAIGITGITVTATETIDRFSSAPVFADSGFAENAAYGLR